MKKTLLLLMHISMGSLLVACGPSQAELDATATQIAGNIFATQTAEVPPTPTPHPMSDAVLTLEDLPPVFMEEPLENFGVEPGKGEGLIVPVIENGFAFVGVSFVKEKNIEQLILGSTELLKETTEQAEWDLIFQQFSELFLNIYAQLPFGEWLIELEEIPNLDDIGETSVGVSGVQAPYGRMDTVFFRRGIVGTVIWTMYYVDDPPIVSIEEVARILDSRIIEILSQD